MKFKPNDYFLKQYPDLLSTKEVGEILRIRSLCLCALSLFVALKYVPHRARAKPVIELHE